MTARTLARISIRSEDEADAINHLKNSGYLPTKTEKDGDGSVVLIYETQPEELVKLALALPEHLHPRFGITRRNDA